MYFAEKFFNASHCESRGGTLGGSFAPPSRGTWIAIITLGQSIVIPMYSMSESIQSYSR